MYVREPVGSSRVEPTLTLAYCLRVSPCSMTHTTLLVCLVLSQYLMGAAFHRGADSDLGPIVHDHAGGHGDVHARL